MPRKKAKYIYNTHTLKYEPEVVSWGQRFLKWFGQGAATLTAAVIIVIITYYTYDSPKDRMHQREIARLKFEYELMNSKMDDMEKILRSLQSRDNNIFRAIFEAEPISDNIRRAGFGGANRYKELEGFSNSELLISTRKRLDTLSKQMYVQSKSYDELSQLVKRKSEMLAALPAIQPISNKDLVRIASGFGNRIHPFYKTIKLHTGIDFTAPIGTDIYCTGDGTVIDTDLGSGYGHNVIVDHGFGYRTIYAHMHEIRVKKGQKVKRGDVLGTVGNSGLSMAPHLHYEVVKNGTKVDPINYFYNDLTPEEYERMIELASQHNQSFD
ncbi:MAG TPA: M23 family metallopeptidase [Chitinophagales bacterium]|nr:M23 family metallopeptidase [Chitinophagales bacterium]